MSKRNDRREAERTARKLAFTESRQKPPQQPVPAQVAENISQAVHQPISEAQLAANRANAQLSSGPVTPSGKAVSSRNHTSHGLTTTNSDADGENFRILACENQSVYDHDLATFRAEWKPKTATENDLVNRLATHQWLRRRALRLQEAVFDSETGEPADVKKFDLYRRYGTSHERSFNRALADLFRLRAFQLRQQNGFESQTRKNEEHQFKMQRMMTREQLYLAAQYAKLNRKSPNLAPLTPSEALPAAA